MRTQNLYKLVLAVTCCITAVVGVAQQPINFDGVQFDVPSGWTSRDSGDGLMKLVPSDLQTGEGFSVAVSASETLTGDFSSWFASKWSRVGVPPLNALQRTPPQFTAAKSKGGYESFQATVVIEDPNHQRYQINYIGIHGGDQACIVMIMVCGPSSLIRTSLPAEPRPASNRNA